MSTEETAPQALSDEDAQTVAATLEHFNANHADTVLLLVRFAAGCPDATDAEALGVDPFGIDFAIRVGDETGVARLTFAHPAFTADDVQAQVYAGLAGARATAGDTVPETSIEREFRTSSTLPTYISQVAEVRDLTPNLREIVLAGGLDDFVPIGGDQFVYLFVGRDGVSVPDDYSMTAFMSTPPDERPFGAYYTVRSWDPDRRAMVLWMVVHGADHGVGAWAERCAVGDRVGVWGPRHGFEMPADASGHLFVVDESGLAAAAAFIDELPGDRPIRVIAETIDPDHVVDLPHRSHVAVTWLFRGDDPPGVGTRMFDAVVATEIDATGLVVFGAGESRQVTAIRKHLRVNLGMSADRVSMTGYWRRGAH